MYDRKTWIVVALCVGLLGLNMFYMQKNTADLRKQQESAASAIPAAGGAGTPAVSGDKPALTVVEPLPQTVEQLVYLKTAEAEFTLTTYGGGVKNVAIRDQHGVEGPVLLNRHGANSVGALASGTDDIESTIYEYVDGESVDGQKAVFRGKLKQGLLVTKTWALAQSGTGSAYQLDFSLEIRNATGQPAMLENYSLFLGAAAPVGKNERLEGTQLIYLDGDSFRSIGASAFEAGFFGLKSAKPIVTESAQDLIYAGVADQFFATVLKPAEKTSSVLWAKPSEAELSWPADKDQEAGSKRIKAVRGGMALPKAQLADGEARTFVYSLFAGPKTNRVLQKMEDEQKVGWGEIMNYGMFGWVSRFMNRSMVWIHDHIDGFTGKASWGVAVILLTVVIRIAIWPLYNRSNRTAKRMSKLKPEMDKLREKYPDDPGKVGQETMKLYKTYGINPLGSCLPMFAQLPIFLGFFSMLNHAVELRGHGFLWVADLSEPDTFGHILGIPINILPILMAITSFIQMAMMPTTGGDKATMMMMKLMPLLFLFICYNSAAGLALYWTTSNLFSIAQMWISNRMPEPELKPVKAGVAGKSWMEKLAERAEEQRMRQAKGRVVEDEPPVKKRPPRTGG